MGYAGLPSHISKDNFAFLDCCGTNVRAGFGFQKHPRKPTRLSTPCGTWGVLLTQGDGFALWCHWMVSVSLDDTSRGQHCSQWNLRLCGPAGLDPQCHSERQHPLWEGIWWRKARNVWFLSCFPLGRGRRKASQVTRLYPNHAPDSGSFCVPQIQLCAELLLPEAWPGHPSPQWSDRGTSLLPLPGQAI